MIVRLSLLNKGNAINIPKVVDVVSAEDGYEVIGSCGVFQDEQGNYLGDLKLHRHVADSVYFYYINLVSNDGIFLFHGLLLTQTELKGTYTTRLRDMVIDY